MTTPEPKRPYQPEVVSVPKAALQRLLAETRGPVALGQITAQTAWDALAEACGMDKPLPVVDSPCRCPHPRPSASIPAGVRCCELARCCCGPAGSGPSRPEEEDHA